MGATITNQDRHWSDAFKWSRITTAFTKPVTKAVGIIKEVGVLVQHDAHTSKLPNEIMDLLASTNCEVDEVQPDMVLVIYSKWEDVPVGSLCGAPLDMLFNSQLDNNGQYVVVIRIPEAMKSISVSDMESIDGPPSSYSPENYLVFEPYRLADGYGTKSLLWRRTS